MAAGQVGGRAARVDGPLAVLLADVATGASRHAALPGPFDVRDLEHLHARVADIARRYALVPSAALLAEAGRCHAALRQRLTDAPSSSGRRAACQAAAESAILLSQLVWDASGRRDVVSTLAFVREAGEHAVESGDVTTTAEAQLRRTYVALYSRLDFRDVPAGLVAAQTAAEVSRPVSAALTGLADLHVAEAWAMQGESRHCERALDRAQVMLADTPDGDAHTAAAPTFERLAGSCYLALGLPERAEPLLTQAADALRDRPKTRSLVLGNLALSRLRQRQLETATATLHAAVDLLEVSHGGGGMTVVFAAARELNPWRSEKEVQDLYDRLLGLVARN